MFDYETERKIISSKLYDEDQNHVDRFVQQNGLSQDSQEADMLMRDLDLTRVQRSVVIMSFYQYVGSTQYSISELDVTYDVNTAFYHLNVRGSGELLSVGALF